MNSTCIWRRRVDSNPGQLVGDECSHNCIPASHTAVSIQKNDIVYVLLTKGEVKLSRRLNFFSFFVFMDRDEVDVNKKSRKERGEYPAILTEQSWLIKDLLYGQKENFFLQESFPLGHPRQVCSHLCVRLNLKMY